MQTNVLLKSANPSGSWPKIHPLAEAEGLSFRKRIVMGFAAAMTARQTHPYRLLFENLFQIRPLETIFEHQAGGHGAKDVLDL